MYELSLELTGLGRVDDPTVKFFDVINSKYPELDLNQTNAYISLVKSSITTTQPLRTIAKVVSLNTNKSYSFYYQRLDIHEITKDFKLLETELSHLNKQRTSERLLRMLSDKYETNFLYEDFWVEHNNLELCGGSDGPNFLLEATFDNLWFTGTSIIKLRA